MTAPRQGADRVRVEIEVDGKTIAYEMVSEGEQKIPFTCELNRPEHELPDTFGWRNFVLGERIRLHLEAFGWKVVRSEPDGDRHG